MRIRTTLADGLIPLAFACLLVSYIESVSAARTLAAKNGDEVDARQELLGLSAASFIVAFGQGFPVAGGLSRSAVNDKAGAKSPLASLVASGTLSLCLVYLPRLLENLPNVVLAAIVLVAVKGLIDVSALRRLRRVSRFEFRIALVAFAGVLLLGILKGVLLAAIVSVLLLLTAAARPHVAFLSRIPGTQRWRSTLTKVVAGNWPRDGRTFHGLLFGHQLGATLGRYVSDLELIAVASDPDGWINVVFEHGCYTRTGPASGVLTPCRNAARSHEFTCPARASTCEARW